MTVNRDDSWKSRTYIMGLILGAAIGLMSAYLFVRSAEENPETGRPEPIQTGTLITLLLAILGLMRQIAESGKPRRK
ncbi:hypothetical protein CEN41_01940 [Fischerella thermalis CCMEE 5330]|uniref:Uncharacterized protein n=1 Tax=Fischerella thermalis CCMEE 5330 TaxID=2019670 RepID=A0A2N6MNI6_9CYAN|nr:hypothetical protein CEN41_01940 [Fischerella thermalis CCMEE 5330]